MKSVLSVPKNIFLLICTSVLISANWLTYIWAVNNGHLLDASLGYFINPIINVLLGMVFLSEKLRKLQWVAILLAVAGILIQVVALGYLPWVALVLSCSFGFYGLLRKKLQLNPLVGLFIETTIMLPIAAIYLFIFAESATSDLTMNSLNLNLLLLSAALVTTVPLLCFNHAAVRLPLSTLGFFQYIGPTLLFIMGVTLFDEVVTNETLMTFSFIWAGLVLFSIDGIKHSRHQSARLKAE